MFGSDGIVFEAPGRFAEVDPMAAYFVSYEIEASDTVLSFMAIQPLTETSEETADAVILANGRYLDQI